MRGPISPLCHSARPTAAGEGMGRDTAGMGGKGVRRSLYTMRFKAGDRSVRCVVGILSRCLLQ